MFTQVGFDHDKNITIKGFIALEQVILLVIRQQST